ncbi:putative carboxylesterase [Aspergillus fischeri NRRL 181]|uniref:Uncharacterized protein n=1 Tax=Neosartorya fischeri (strain ATCC 1020 / DSM 3700 / CBS 544.65 / FGSC A1164 / JCM 1740 / NRRL 181 / WB 181) TaxID=331117 RepID=A1DKH7_NEOFI|nr:conserved hypothetical protein [Aspergillus fischeri NRRL 181]EAW17216.1 conserved hypothetical protein [Aspergillus fischeri NRRL 181]KAG2004095.1 hypothetical protein GB937_009112 [Aspergillus fischeri]
MASLSAFLHYLRLKLLISFYRLFVKILTSPPRPRPDSVLRIPSRDKGRTINAHLYKPSWEYEGTMDLRDPRISPAYADASKYPANMLVITAELDSSALEAEDLAKKAETEGTASGRNVVLRRIRECGHAFDKKNTDEACVQARDEAYGLAVDMLRKVASESG